MLLLINIQKEPITITTKQKNRSALDFDHQGKFGYTHNAPFLHNSFHFLFSNFNTPCMYVCILIHIPWRVGREWNKIQNRKETRMRAEKVEKFIQTMQKFPAGKFLEQFTHKQQVNVHECNTLIHKSCI